jgi:hypothetical protein
LKLFGREEKIRLRAPRPRGARTPRARTERATPIRSRPPAGAPARGRTAAGGPGVNLPSAGTSARRWNGGRADPRADPLTIRGKFKQRMNRRPSGTTEKERRKEKPRKITEEKK